MCRFWKGVLHSRRKRKDQGDTVMDGQVMKYIKYMLLKYPDDYVEFIECVKTIPVHEKASIHIGRLKNIIIRIYRGEINDVENELSRAVENVPEKYLRFLARAILLCKEYAKRYEKCWELEKTKYKSRRNREMPRSSG